MSTNLPNIPHIRFEDLPALPFDTIQKPLDDLLLATANSIERSWPQQYSGNDDLKVFLLGTVKILANTYNSIRYLAADKPVNSERKLEFSVSIPPLSRTILDSLFTFVFIFDDPQNRISWYHKSGWRELFEEHQRYKTAYANNPAWTDYLAWGDSLINHTRNNFYITEQEATEPEKHIKWWPNGQDSREGSVGI